MPHVPDLRPASDTLKTLDWSPHRRSHSLLQLYAYTLDQARNAIAWYDAKRSVNRFWAYSFRVTALVAVTLAGVIPTLARLDSLQLSSGRPLFDPLLSTVFVAVAGFALAADRFCGFTTGWVRYAQASLQIGDAVHQFLLNWQAAAASAGASLPPAPADFAAHGRMFDPGVPPDALSEVFIGERIDACRQLLNRVQQTVQGETNAWAAEFQKALKTIDDSCETRRGEPPPTLPGAVNITVSNADHCDAGWKLTLDSGAPQPCTGKLAARHGLSPGTHRLAAQGVIAGRPVAAEVAFEVQPGKVAAVNVTLT